MGRATRSIKSAPLSRPLSGNLNIPVTRKYSHCQDGEGKILNRPPVSRKKDRKTQRSGGIDQQRQTMETLTGEWRYHGGKKAGEGKNGREQRWILWNNLEDVPVPSGEQFMQHTHVHTGKHVINIVVVVAARACINYSAPSRKCVVTTAMGAPRGLQHY